MSERVTKLGSVKGPQALEVFAELLPLIFKMAEDEEAQSFFTAGRALSRTEQAEKLISLVNKHSDTFYAIEAAKRNISAEECRNDLSIDEIFLSASELMTDGIFLCFFSLSRKDRVSPTSAPENTEGLKASMR